MNLKIYENKLKKLSEMMDSYEIGKYTTTRDDDANLIIKFADGSPFIMLPIIQLREYQKAAQIELYKNGILRHWWMWTRRMGKEVMSWILLIQGAIETPGLYVMIYPTNVRAREVIWDGDMIMEDGRSFKFLDMIPEKLLLKVNNSEMKAYLTNGAIIHCYGIDTNPNKPRGTNPRGVVMSEVAWIDPRVIGVMMPILQQNKGWLILQSTFDGMNHFYRTGLEIKEEPLWHHSFYTAETCVDKDGKRYITEEVINQDRKILPDWLVLQEHYGIVQNNPESMFFSREMANIHENGKIVPELLYPQFAVYAFWDIGVNDCTVVLLVQFDHNNNPTIINCIEDNNKNIHFYLERCTEFCAKHGLYLESHFAPHDGRNRSITSGNNITYQPETFVDVARDLGHSFQVVARPQNKINAINAMRIRLNTTKFNKENTVRLIECLSAYGKEFDEKNNVYRDKPHPKWATHCVDAFQTMTLATQANMVQNTVSDVIYYTDQRDTI